jgi:hypothetical protein
MRFIVAAQRGTARQLQGASGCSLLRLLLFLIVTQVDLCRLCLAAVTTMSERNDLTLLEGIICV